MRTKSTYSALAQGMSRFDTGPQAVISNSTSAEIFNPLTGPIDSAQIRDVRVRLWLAGRVALDARPAIQFSSDGVNWTDSDAPLWASYAAANGWTFYSTTVDIGSTGATERMFVRFGVQARNSAGAAVEGAMARLVAEVAPVDYATYTLNSTLVFTRGSTTVANEVPLSPPAESTGVSETRASIEMDSTTGDCDVQLIWQETDTPDQPTSWQKGGGIGNSISNPGRIDGTTFAAIAPTKAYIRLAAESKNLTGSVVAASRVSARWEVR